VVFACVGLLDLSISGLVDHLDHIRLLDRVQSHLSLLHRPLGLVLNFTEMLSLSALNQSFQRLLTSFKLLLIGLEVRILVVNGSLKLFHGDHELLDI
jgi:hypothetical protein